MNNHITQKIKLPPLKFVVTSLTRIIHAQCEAGVFDPILFKNHINPYEAVNLYYEGEIENTHLTTTLGENLIEHIPEEYLIDLVAPQWTKQSARYYANDNSLLYIALTKGKFKLARAMVTMGFNEEFKGSKFFINNTGLLRSIFEDLERPINFVGKYLKGVDQEQYTKDFFDFALFSATLHLHTEERKKEKHTSLLLRKVKKIKEDPLSLACGDLNFNPLNFVKICIQLHLHESVLYAIEHPLINPFMSKFSHFSPKQLIEEDKIKLPSYVDQFQNYRAGMTNNTLYQQSIFQVAADNGSYNNLKWLEEHYFHTNQSEKQKTALDLMQSLQEIWTNTKNSHEKIESKEKQTLPRIKYFKTMLHFLDITMVSEDDTIKKPDPSQTPSGKIFTHCLEIFSPLSAQALINAMPHHAKNPQILKFEEQLICFSAQDYHLMHYCGREIEAAITEENNSSLDPIVELALSTQSKEFLPQLLNRMETLTQSANPNQTAKWQEIRLKLLAGIPLKTQKFKI